MNAMESFTGHIHDTDRNMPIMTGYTLNGGMGKTKKHMSPNIYLVARILCFFHHPNGELMAIYILVNMALMNSMAFLAPTGI